MQVCQQCNSQRWCGPIIPLDAPLLHPQTQRRFNEEPISGRKKACQDHSQQAFDKTTSCHGLHPGGNVFPVHQIVQEVGQVDRTLVAEVDVVGVLPHVAAQKRSLIEAKWVHAVFGLGHSQGTVCVFHQPAPAGAKLTCACGGELFFELINRAKRLNQRLFQLTWHGVGAWTHHFPELVVVPQLRDVVEDAVLGNRVGVIGANDYLFQRFAFPLGAGDGGVAVCHIGVVVQVVVEFQRLCGHAFVGQSVVGVRKIRELKSHCSILFCCASYLCQTHVGEWCVRSRAKL
mmetsp:Transcript_23185/g.39677  ORF Transcript_23185/g.39677 Transcript_23185/m.39677 type:complete len:288 (+) Transcript_23185:767-1630(+)